MNRKVTLLVTGFTLGLLTVAWLRMQSDSAGLAGVLSDYATLLYIAISVAAAVTLIRCGAPLRRLGFGPRFRLSYVALAVAGVVLLQLGGALLAPLWEQLFGAARDLARFADVQGSLSQLLAVLALSWTVAAFGEELAFRIVLMRGIAYALGDGRTAFAIALVAQAAVFGIIHAYQGPAGIAGTFTSGLVFGALTLIARGSIWPAALAHGLNNTIGLLEIYAAGT